LMSPTWDYEGKKFQKNEDQDNFLQK
jgi:hypothetical protein